MKWRIQLRDHGKAAFLVECDRGTHHGTDALECHRSLWRGPPTATNGVATMWQWNGSVESPTITPSIDCQGGCGRHFNMTVGVPEPDTP